MNEMSQRIRNIMPLMVFAVGWVVCRYFELDRIPFMVGYLTGGIALIMYQGGVK